MPLCGRAVAVRRSGFAGDWNEAGDEELVRDRPGKTLHAATISKLVRDPGIAAVPHGFRSSFRDCASERTNDPREVVEAAPAHAVRKPGPGGLRHRERLPSVALPADRVTFDGVGLRHAESGWCSMEEAPGLRDRGEGW